MTGPVHFIHLGGPWYSQFTRAVKTARRHGAQIIVWATDVVPQIPDVRREKIWLPPWLQDHPIGLANVKDLYAYGLLYEHGGIYLDLDTITLRPAWDLLGDADLCVSTEFPPGQEAGRIYNTAAMIARPETRILDDLYETAERRLKAGLREWGGIGPHLVSDLADRGEIAGAPYRALNGWSYHSIGDYYANPRDPGEDVRVIHLYSSDHLNEFLADKWTPET